MCVQLWRAEEDPERRDKDVGVKEDRGREKRRRRVWMWMIALQSRSGFDALTRGMSLTHSMGNGRQVQREAERKRRREWEKRRERERAWERPIPLPIFHSLSLPARTPQCWLWASHNKHVERKLCNPVSAWDSAQCVPLPSEIIHRIHFHPTSRR